MPVCECHGVAKYWAKDGRNKMGGYWRCSERRKAFDKRQNDAYYWERMPFEVRARRGLYQRSRVALIRRRERQQRRD